MRHSLLRAGLLTQLILSLCLLWATVAAAQPGAGPRERVNHRFTTKHPGSPTGVSDITRFHAAGDNDGNPPYLRKIVFDPPRAMHYDTSVPARCSASDAELRALGGGACPAGSRLGGGTTEGLIMEPFAHDFVFDHYEHHVDVYNNANEQIILVKSEGYTVVRGQIRRDGSIAFDLPTCFPAPPVGECVDNYIVQLKTATTLPPYTTKSGGRLRSYATTPARCPDRGYWRTHLRLWWANGKIDKVTSKQPCRPR